MAGVERGFQHDTDVLVRLIDSQLAILRTRCRGAELVLAEQLAAALRDLVVATTRASAVDRARVRAGVHRFVLREGRNGRRGGRPLSADQRMVNEIALHLHRPDLVVTDAPAAPVDQGLLHTV
ncbi:hypothetical protein SAMN05444365_102481 [Micromonospora pattaloongensis]|uniref:Uncharacterized protein n=1 Tax=Micromonospora pattaloongensis TaxID=405436 RepID=A0A1H3KFJ1_9ACTN|nr:hypothetical protein [Micromonospora pattaloongensis]SDY50972.1 hypothetical protein SAMN05444365_102481 [Micromonospora pattaloongensis]